MLKRCGKVLSAQMGWEPGWVAPYAACADRMYCTCMKQAVVTQ